MSRGGLTNPDAERALIGCVFLRPECLTEAEHLTPEDFHVAAHRAIWRATLALVERGAELDTFSVAAELGARGDLTSGVREALREAEESTLSSANVVHFATSVEVASLRRRVVGACDHLRGRASDAEVPANELLAEVDRSLSEIGERAAGEDPIPYAAALRGALAEIDAERKGQLPAKAPSGLPTLDALVGGVGKGELFVLAARPGVGKSSLAFQWAVHSTRKGFGAYVVALEMRAQELARRALAASARVPQSSLKSLRLTEQHMGRMLDVASEGADLPLWFADSTRQSMSDIRAQVRRWKRKQPGLALVVVDYLQLVRSDAAKGANREQEVSAVARGLKQLAREADVGVLALSQLSRDMEKAGRRPTLSDLRESGEIEQAADCVLFVHKDKDSSPGNDDAQSVACEVRLAKQRNGRSEATVDVWFRSAWTTFEERAPEWR